MQDRLNARLMGVAPTGNGRWIVRAQADAADNEHDQCWPERTTPQKSSRPWTTACTPQLQQRVSPTSRSGKFVFSTAEAWRIERGKLTYPVKGATLIGNGPDALTRVSMVGADLELDSGVGTCGKDGQSVPVGVGSRSTV